MKLWRRARNEYRYREPEPVKLDSLHWWWLTFEDGAVVVRSPGSPSMLSNKAAEAFEGSTSTVVMQMCGFAANNALKSIFPGRVAVRLPDEVFEEVSLQTTLTDGDLIDHELKLLAMLGYQDQASLVPVDK